MNVIEFSNEFDILYNNSMSNAAPGINEYEKSVFLTKAQDELIKNYYEPDGNKYKKGLDDSLKRQVDFSELIKVSAGELNTKAPSVTFDKRAKIFDLPIDLLLPINEMVETDSGIKQVLSINYEDYTRLMSRPYKEPLKYQAWRLNTTSSGRMSVEVIINSNDTIKEYKVRYVRRPKPIITVNLSSEYGDMTINGEGDVSECELNPIIHQEILQRAVELAKVAYTGDVTALINVGQRSE